MATSTAPARVCFTLWAYLGLARKVSSDAVACSMPATPVISSDVVAARSRSPAPRRDRKVSFLQGTLPPRVALQAARSIVGWHFIEMIDDQHVYGQLGLLQLQSKVFVKGCKDIWPYNVVRTSMVGLPVF